VQVVEAKNAFGQAGAATSRCSRPANSS
jgi:hypothetical protein